MFALSRIYGTLTGQRAVRDRDTQDCEESHSSDSGDNTDTDDDDDGGGECGSPPHSRSSKHFDGVSRHDSGIAFDDTPRSRAESATKLILKQCPSSDQDIGEPFPDIDPLVLAIGVHEFYDPPDLQGLKIDNVEIYIGRLRSDPVFGAKDACAGNAAAPAKDAQDDTEETLVQVLDTSVDFTSASVSRSSSSTMSLKNLKHKEVSLTSPEQESHALKDASPSPVKDSDKHSDSKALEDPFDPPYQLPNEKMEDYVKRVSARFQATLAKHGGEKENEIDTSPSSSASINSRNEDFDTSEEISFNDTDTCPSSPPTPFAPRTPLNYSNLSKLQTSTAISETDEDDQPQPTDGLPEWTPPPITGPPIFNLATTKLTPPRSEVYKHIDFTPLTLFHRRSSTRRYVILEQDCLQCSLKNLPCDDYHPSCKRCQRSDDAPYCLRQRRLASWELRQLGLERVRDYTVLIRLPEDGDEVWEEKLRREEVLLEVLKERLDRGNWVFPVNDGVEDVFDVGAVRGREVCEGRGGIWRYRYIDDARLKVVVDRY